VQRRFDIDVEGEDIVLIGYMDIDEGSTVRDTKTTRGFPKEDDVISSSQLTFYAMAKFVLDGKKPDAVMLDYLLDRSRNKRDTAPKAVTLISQRDEAHFQALLNRIERAQQVIESGVFMPAPPGSWWCSESWCGYWNLCPWVRQGKSIAVKKEWDKKGEGKK
jgi:hypothetical protein